LSGGYPTFNSDARCPHIQARVCKGFTLTIPRANRGRAGPHVGGHRATWAREGKCGRHPQGLEGRSRGLDGEDRSSARRKRDLNPALFCYCSRNGGDGELARAANVSERSLAQVQARPRSQARAPGPDLRSGPDLRPGPQAPITEARASGLSMVHPVETLAFAILGTLTVFTMMGISAQVGSAEGPAIPGVHRAARGGTGSSSCQRVSTSPRSDPLARPQSWRCWSELSRRKAICAINHHEATPQAA